MAELLTTYKDTRNITHSVQHVTRPDGKSDREQALQELFRVLSAKKRNPL